MRFEILIQFIVPLTFLAIWALTSLLNRDAQPLPPRPGRPPGPGGVRPQNRAAGQAAPRPPGPGAPPPQPEAAALRAERPEGRLDFGALQPPRERTPQRPLTGGMDDAIVYIENGPGAAGQHVPPQPRRCQEPPPHRRVRGPRGAASNAGGADRGLPPADLPPRPGRSRRRIAHSRIRSTNPWPNSERSRWSSRLSTRRSALSSYHFPSLRWPRKLATGKATWSSQP